jgi:hypothetical protein
MPNNLITGSYSVYPCMNLSARQGFRKSGSNSCRG